MDRSHNEDAIVCSLASRVRMIKGLVPYRKREWAWCRHEHSEGDLGFLAGL